MAQIALPQTKAEKRMVNAQVGKARAAIRGQARSSRMVGVTAALTAAKLDSAFGEASPKVSIPMLGQQKVSTIIGALAVANYAFSKAPGTAATAAGYAGLATVCRAL
jgi:hypothetical protein